MNSANNDLCDEALGAARRISIFSKGSFVALALAILFCGLPSLAQSAQSPDSQAPAESAGGEQPPGQQLTGTIYGTVVDQTGDMVAGARVTLTVGTQSPSREVLSGEDGQFSFDNVAPGPFQLTITSEGLAPQTLSEVLRPGEVEVIPQVALRVAALVTEVQVGLSPTEVAEEQIKRQEKQRVLRVVPNFYVSYVPNAAPLSSKQKFQLAWKTVIDPVTFGFTAGIAGLEQAQNHFGGYGQGAQGYAKRFGASYADTVSGTFIGSAILPSLLKQDPRYFYKGTGGTRSRALYAIANAVICKGDDGHWEANYSSIAGSFAAGGISNLYYPSGSRNGAELTVENALIGIGENAAANLLQEFVIRKLTPSARNRQPSKSEGAESPSPGA
jgi:hypothetical protein